MAKYTTDTLQFDRTSNTFRGRGAKNPPHLTAERRSTIVLAATAQARSFMDVLYKEGAHDPEAKVALRALSARLDNHREESPFSALHAFMAAFRQYDFLNWRLGACETIQANRKRDNRVERGEISGKTRNFTHEKRTVWDDDHMPDLKIGRDCFFPKRLDSEEALEAFIRERDLTLELDGTVDGKPAISLQTEAHGSWATYVVDGDGYLRTHVSRPGFIRPLGRDLKLHGKKAAKGVKNAT